MTDYFINFVPADAVQYDPPRSYLYSRGHSVEREARRATYDLMCALEDIGWVMVLHRDHTKFGNADMTLAHSDDEDETLVVVEGQWLVRQGDRVWVQDEEPPRVERWESVAYPETESGSVGVERSVEACKELIERDRDRLADHWATGDYDPWRKIRQHRRPVLSNGWTGPWAPVEGGAE